MSGKNFLQCSLTSGSPAMDDYLEQILLLGGDRPAKMENGGGEEDLEIFGEGVRAADISSALNISRASVTNMLQRLARQGLVAHQKYHATQLTKKGMEIARAVVDRHRSLQKLFEKFELDEKLSHQDIEGMEHHISAPTLAIFKALAEELAKDEAFLMKVKKRLGQ